MIEDAAIEAMLAQIAFNVDGLVPVIAQRQGTGEVLMHAWMNRESFTLTMRTGQMTYWSRSRKSLWRKGETSGHVQALKEMHIDCDGDTLLAIVEQTGPACHTGAESCFLRKL